MSQTGHSRLHFHGDRHVDSHVHQLPDAAAPCRHQLRNVQSLQSFWATRVWLNMGLSVLFFRFTALRFRV